MRIKPLAVLFAAALALAAPIQPVAAQGAPRALSQSDVQQAAEQHQAVLDEFGGEADPRLTAYVAGVGRRIAGYTGVAGAGGAYHITVLNSPVRNAFAVPGGYVYITRDLVALMNSEDELAFVIGHEMGHVAARHGQKRQTSNTLGTLGAVLAQVLTGSELVGQVASQVSQGLVLGYSRSQENEADSLGVRYIAAAGYDPFAAPRILSALGAAESLEAAVAGGKQAQAPSWTRTHPLSEDRVQRTDALAAQAQPAGPKPAALSGADRDRFLAAIDGMPFGDDPRQGIVEGREFRHPVLRFKFTAPQGYTIDNGASSVAISGSGGQAQFGSGRLAGGLDAYVGDVFRALAGANGQVNLPATQSTTINGMPAAYASTRARTDRGEADVTVIAYRWSASTAYHFVTITPAGAGIGPFREMIDSLSPMSPSEAAAVRGRVLRIVTVGRGDTARRLAARMAFPDHQLERFLVLNGLDADSALVPGEKLKLVVYGS
jgi:predicted Zn-dependent protease